MKDDMHPIAIVRLKHQILPWYMRFVQTMLQSEIIDRALQPALDEHALPDAQRKGVQEVEEHANDLHGHRDEHYVPRREDEGRSKGIMDPGEQQAERLADLGHHAPHDQGPGRRTP
eukprot:732352-Hanusia_phi.AAC.3